VAKKAEKQPTQKARLKLFGHQEFPIEVTGPDEYRAAILAKIHQFYLPLVESWEIEDLEKGEEVDHE
jgi:hypothetical protein